MEIFLHKKSFVDEFVQLVKTFSFSGILLHGTEGVGKTFFIKNCVIPVLRKDNTCRVRYISSVNDIYEGRIGSSENNVFEIISKLKKEISKEWGSGKKFVLVFDDFDLISSKSKDLHRTERLVCCEMLQFFEEVKDLNRVKEDSNTKILIISICSSERVDMIDKDFFGLGKLEKNFSIPFPSSKHRKEILETLISKNRLTTSPKNKNDLKLEEVVEKTHGFTIGDLIVLISSSIREDQTEQYLNIPNHLLQKPGSFPLSENKESTKHHDNNSLSKSMKGCFDPSLLQSIEFSILKPLREPEKFRIVGIRPPKGILFYGPPGNGKTFLAKTVAREVSHASFISVSCVDILSKVVGKSSRKISQLFQFARLRAPCILFFDQFETLARKRTGQNRSMDQMLSTLLVEMDGVFSGNEHGNQQTGMKNMNDVIVFASTNRKDLLDPAILRPGRLDLHVFIPYPNWENLKTLFLKFTENVPMDRKEILGGESSCLEGYMKRLEECRCSVAQLENIVRETSMRCVRKNVKRIRKVDLEETLEEFWS